MMDKQEARVQGGDHEPGRTYFCLKFPKMSIQRESLEILPLFRNPRNNGFPYSFRNKRVIYQVSTMNRYAQQN
jgi:hypothetical protein